MFKLQKVKSCLTAAFTFNRITSLKNAYAIVFVICLGFGSNTFKFIIYNIFIDVSLTLLNYKFNKNIVNEKELVEFEETIFEPNFKTKNFEDCIKKIKNVKGILPFLLGWDGTKEIIADMTEFIHVLIAGRSGKGKSNFINQLIQSLICWSDNLAMFLCDFKKVELADYKPFKNCKVFFDAQTLLLVIKNIRLEMQRRYELLLDVKEGTKTYKKISQYNKYNPKLPYIVLLIDEFADLSYIPNEDLRNEIWDEIKWVLREGRAAGCYIILATQRPTKENIPPSIKNLMVTCIGFGVSNEHESSYCGVQGSKGLDKGYMVVNGENLENQKLKSYLIKDNDKIYYKLLEEHKDGN